ncbi:MAG: hypothetical protein EOO51_04415, partial [Flavobacterium sp.]
MKRNLLFLICLFSFWGSYSQLSVNNNLTPTQLIQNVLLGGGVTVSNVKFNGNFANANAIRDQAGNFTNGSTTNLGIDQGIILATGKVMIPPGPPNQQPVAGPNNTGGATNTSVSTNYIDADLAQIDSDLDNAAVLEFDFVPNGQTLTFQYVFASEEYPEFVNSYNDAFGFFLSGPGIAGPFSNGAVNIATIPSTTLPVTIDNVNNGNTNSGPCTNCAYYVNNGTGLTPAVNSTIQYDGFTTVLTATATVQCGQTYHIKLAIGNVLDNALDSGVFLKSGSFNVQTINFPTDLLIANGQALCPGESTQLCTGLAASVPHTWTVDGVVIPGETTPCLTVTQPGTYCATAYPYGPGCPVSDCVVIEYQPPIPINPPANLCHGPAVSAFDISVNTPTMLGSLPAGNYDIYYYTSYADALSSSNPILNTTSYPGIDGEIIYVRVDDVASSGCYLIVAFSLTINATCGPEPVQPPNLTVCDDSSNDGSAIFDFTPQTAIAMGANDPADFTLTYHLSQADADSGSNPISPINNFVGTDGQTIYIRLESNTDATAFGTTSFQLFINPVPTASISGTTTICSGGTAMVTFTGTPGA